MRGRIFFDIKNVGGVHFKSVRSRRRKIAGKHLEDHYFSQNNISFTFSAGKFRTVHGQTVLSKFETRIFTTVKTNFCYFYYFFGSS
jgi:hypothetical protein